MRVNYEQNRIEDLNAYLKANKPKMLIVLTSLVSGGWYDNEFDATQNGYKISRVRDYDYVKSLCKRVKDTQFNEWYVMERR